MMTDNNNNNNKKEAGVFLDSTPSAAVKTSTERSKARSLMMMTDNNSNKKEAGVFLDSASCCCKNQLF